MRDVYSKIDKVLVWVREASEELGEEDPRSVSDIFSSCSQVALFLNGGDF
jgi:hypothetical protein